jgi:hypothetical protein
MKAISSLRQHMIDDITARRYSENVQKAYVRQVTTFAAFLGRSPDASPPQCRALFLNSLIFLLRASGVNPRRDLGYLVRREVWRPISGHLAIRASLRVK